jgi:hypothetical protein
MQVNIILFEIRLDTTGYDMRNLIYIFIKMVLFMQIIRHNGHSTTNLDKTGIMFLQHIDLSVGDYVEAYVLINVGSGHSQNSFTR